MEQAHFLQKLYTRYSPEAKELPNLKEKAAEWADLPVEEKQKLAEEYLKKGEDLLAKKSFSAIEFFNAAATLDPKNHLLWYRQGRAFLEIGKQKRQEKALFLATKNFKLALELKNDFFSGFYELGQALYILGENTLEEHYLQSAKENFAKAIALSKNEPKETVASLYWDYAKAFMKLASGSQEAFEIKQAIQAFRMSFAHQTKLSSQFWYEYGLALYEMALLINDNQHYLAAIDHFQKALLSNKGFKEAYLSIARAYRELYINTLSEDFFNKASSTYAQFLMLEAENPEILLEWAGLLCESGKLSKSLNKLELSCQKCLLAYQLKPKNLLITGQWTEALSLWGAAAGRLDLILEAQKKIEPLLEKKSDRPELYFAYAVCLNALAEYYNDTDYNERAIKELERGLSLDHLSAELWHELANTEAKIGLEYEDEDLLKKAAKHFSKAIDLKPLCPNLTFDFGFLLLELGERAEDQKIIEEAISYLEATLHNQKDALLNYPKWLFTYGRALDLLGDCSDEENSYYKKAISAFQNVLLINPDYPKVHFHLGLSFAHLGEFSCEKNCYEQAIGFYKLALKQNEEDDQAYSEWGLALINLGQMTAEETKARAYYLEAEQKILKAGALGNQQAYYHLACLYSLLKKPTEALELLFKAHQNNVLPSLEEILEDDWLDHLKMVSAFKDFVQMVQKEAKYS
ncbi:MAG: hypothetical protein WC371_01555 [Parachlamydiales bacterium]|jgi:tetratricopeptide (TPR) repeat protein